jgi:hypothetical protein
MGEKMASKKVEILEQKGIQFLWIKDKLIDWNIPTEEKILKTMANKAFGDVLVVGYKLGVIQKCLMENLNVKSVTTIVKDKKVVEECHKIFGKVYGKILVGNFFRSVINKEYDCVLTDTCKGIVLESLSYYRRFKKRAKKLVRPKGKIFAWGKNYFEYEIDSDKMKEEKIVEQNYENGDEENE